MVKSNYEDIYIQYDQFFYKYHLKYRTFSENEQIELFAMIQQFWINYSTQNKSDKIKEQIYYNIEIMKNFNIYDKVSKIIHDKKKYSHITKHNFDIINLFGIRTCVTQKNYDELNNDFKYDIFHINLTKDSSKNIMLFHIKDKNYKIKIKELHNEYIKTDVNNKEYTIPIRLLFDIDS